MYDIEKLNELCLSNELEKVVSVREGKTLAYFDCDSEQNVVLNDMSLLSPKDLVRCIDENSYLNKDILFEMMKKIQSILFIPVQEIVFVFSENDCDYLDAEYSIWVNNSCLGQYNAEHAVAVVNIRCILKKAGEVAIASKLDLNDFRKTIDKCIIETLIHELGHAHFAADYLRELYPLEHSDIVNEFSLNVDFDDEEDFVEDMCLEIADNLVDDFNIISTTLSSQYMLKGESLFNDGFFDDEF